VHGEEVETCLVRHPGVSQVAVIGVPDKKWGLRIEAHVSRSDDVTEDQLRQWCRTSGLASFKQPKKYVFHRKLPTGVTGKLDRVSLREKYRDMADASSLGSA
jgi:2-furoate---CoA ligase